MSLRFLILGCGWVGEAFAKKMQQLGHEVYATTTQEYKCQRLNDEGICTFLLNFDEPIRLDKLPQSVDYILTSVPAARSLDVNRLKSRFGRVNEVLNHIGFKANIFLSSVGIYPDVSGEFDEKFLPIDDSNLSLAERELFRDCRTTVYRLGGLFGQKRIFAKYFEGKQCDTAGQRSNFIHQDDVIELIYLGLTRGLTEPIYNLVCPEHPLKKDVIIASARKYGFMLPVSFNDNQTFQKVVRGEKIMRELGYSFFFDSPLLF